MTENERPLNPTYRQRIELENLTAIHKQLPTSLAGISLAAIAVFWDLSYIIDDIILTIWLGLVLGINCIRYLIDRIKFDIYISKHKKQFYFFGSLLSGLLWGGILIVASNYNNIGAIAILTTTTACSSALALVSHAYYPLAYYAYTIPSLLGMSISFMRYETDHDNVAFILTSLFFLILITYCRNLNENFSAATKLKLKNEDLMEKIKKQALLAKNTSIEKSRFLTAVSHDLRQPFHALSLFVDSIQESSLNEPTKAILTNIKLSISAQERLFTEFLDISKLDAGAITPHISSFPTNTLLHELKAEYQNIAQKKGLKFFCENPDYCIKSDQLLCERIIRNILSNAITYTVAGSISINVTANDTSITISITDTGIGIHEDKLETIFLEFEQLHNPERDRNNGLGLGLATVKQHCKLLGLDIHVSSTYGKGSTFSITLPRSWPDSLEEHETKRLPFDFQAQTIKGAKVLIIDNDTLVLKATNTQLTALGCKVSCARNLANALMVLSDDRNKPDILLCDLRLGGKHNGIEVIQKINQFLKQNIPSIIITGETNQQSIQDVQKTDSVLLHKPIQKAKFIMALHSLLIDRKTTQQD